MTDPKIAELTRANQSLQEQVNELGKLLKGEGANGILDPTFARYLDNAIGVEKKKLSDQKKRFEADTRHKADAYQKAIDAVKEELRQRDSKLAELKKAHAIKLAELQEKCTSTIAELERKHKDALSELERKHEAKHAEELAKNMQLNNKIKNLTEKLTHLRALKTSRSRSPGIISKVKHHFMSAEELEEYDKKHKAKQSLQVKKQKEIDKARRELGPGAISRFMNRIKGKAVSKTGSKAAARTEFRRKLKEDDWEAVKKLYSVEN
jgi:chromosome segregation ATPase